MSTTLDDLWNSVPPSTRTFDPGELAHLPEPARRYLAHAIASGTPLASAVRLRMHGEIKLKGERPAALPQDAAVGKSGGWGVPLRGLRRRGRGRADVRRLYHPVPVADRMVFRLGAFRIGGGVLPVYRRRGGVSVRLSGRGKVVIQDWNLAP